MEWSERELSHVTWPDGLKGCTSVSEGLQLCWIVLKRFSSFVISCAIGLPRPSVHSWTEHWTGVASAQPLGWWRTLWIGSMFEGWNLRVQLCPCLHKNCCSAVFCHLFIFEFSNVEGAGERVQPGATLVRHGRMKSHGLWQSVAWSSVNGKAIDGRLRLSGKLSLLWEKRVFHTESWDQG